MAGIVVEEVRGTSMRIWCSTLRWYSVRSESEMSKNCGTASPYSRRLRSSVLSRHARLGGR